MTVSPPNLNQLKKYVLCFFSSFSSKPSCFLPQFNPHCSHASCTLLSAPQHTSFLLPPHTHLHLHTPPYLYGMCLLPLTRARITLPRADRERHRGAELGEEFSLFFPPLPPPPPPPSTLTSQLPRSSRWRRLRPPDTSKAEKNDS